MRKWKKICLPLTLALLVTSLPAGVFAEETGEKDKTSETETVICAADASENTERTQFAEEDSYADGVMNDAAAVSHGAEEGNADTDVREEEGDTDPDFSGEEFDMREENTETSEGDDMPAVTVRLNNRDHIKYMNGSSDGLFHPDSPLTRAESAQMIHTLLDSPAPKDRIRDVTFEDVSSSAWYAAAVKSLSDYGVMSGSAGRFRPDADITRTEFIMVLANFYLRDEDAPAQDRAEISFSDVSDSFWGREVILWAAGKGWVTGYADGTFHPENTLTRAEAAVILNRVLGRSADDVTVQSAEGICLFPDVKKSHWAYEPIMEASIGHEYVISEGTEIWTSFTPEKTALSPGTYVFDGTLYCVSSETGDFVRNAYADGHWYDADGKYVTGNSQLDKLMRDATRAAVTPGMTQHQMLQATFDYTVSNFTYLVRPILDMGAVGWTESYAVPMFQKRKGNCYSFAAVYYYLTKNIGYNPREVSGVVGRNRRPHGWIEIDKDATTYIYDTELTMAKRRDGYNYYLFEMTYDDAPFIYAKQ